ncbi:unnamed protein product [Darwinula stevensoni]|uniref:Kringle domain-containing protein n=1 Tax=Darwinula stevensoni TaxID=69355 RepID=A0A7R9ADU8_9CRUS|nr:unnamed protein product [Darwinula stevensoni]CAG0901101.1 unnamed protein product [Darwinula stevensoni]
MVPMECKLTHYGGEYLGKKNVSRSRNPCLPWLSRVSSDNQYDNVLPAFSDSLDSRHNFCRNPNGAVPSPWCWTTTHGNDPQMEECDIPFCFELLLEYPSNSPPECKLTVSGGEYAGRKNETNWGLPCQSWNISGNNGLIEEMNRWAAFSDNAQEKEVLLVEAENLEFAILAFGGVGGTGRQQVAAGAGGTGFPDGSHSPEM